MKHKHENNMNTEACSSHCQMDTPVKPEHDSGVKLSPSDTPSLSPSDLIGGSIKQQCRMDSRLRGNDRGESGRFPLSVSLGRSETKTRGSIIAESGRSMVEMLGTLAIIGVLSVGGIAGYSYGMDKYRANETINDVNLRGIDLVRQVAIGQTTLSLSEWPTISKAGYDISEPVLSTEGDAYFSLSGVPKRVCEMVYDGIMQNQTTDVEVNGYVVDDSSACGDDNKMGFFFITNAGKGGTNPEDLCKDKTCPEGFSCTHGICMSEEVPQLASNGASIGERYCKKDSECPECAFCAEWGGCTIKTDGTACSGGTCYNGRCILNDDTCMSHDECEKGYFCEMGEYFQSHKCTKLEFYKTSLDNVYLFKHGTSMTELCDLAGFQVPTREQVIDISAKLESVFSSSARIHTIDAGRCYPSGECYEVGLEHDAVAYLLCID